MAITGNETLVYNASDLVILIGDVTPNGDVSFTGEPLTGFGEGDFLTISFPEDRVNFRVGADGKEVATCNPMADIGQIVISAMPGCTLYNKLFRLSFPRGTSKLKPFAISITPRSETLSGLQFTERYYSACAVITSRPEFQYGVELPDRSFTIRASGLKVETQDT